MERIRPEPISMTARRAVASALAAVLVAGAAAPPARAGDLPKILHEKLPCVPPDGNARITMRVTSTSPVSSARVYFKSVRYDRDYFLEMRRQPDGTFWAMLPLPEDETKNVQYRLVVKDSEGMVASKDFVAPVDSPCAQNPTEEEERFSKNLVIGLTENEQPVVPEGFRCVGVVSKITVEGEMIPHEECRQLLAYYRRIPVGVWIAGGLAAGTGTILIIKGKDKPVSPSRPSAAPASTP